jgi:hypothetical protein
MDGIRRPDNETDDGLKAEACMESCTPSVLCSQYVLFRILVLACFDP